MREIFRLICLFLLTGPLPLLADDSVAIQLPLKATVVGPAVALGDIAEVDTKNRAVLERLQRIKLANAAPAGGTIKLTQGFIKVVLRREGYNLEGFTFSGVATTEVLTQSQFYSLSDLMPTIKAYVVDQLRESSENVNVKVSGDNKKISLPAGSIKTHFRPPLSGNFEGSFLLTTEFEVDGRVARILPLRVTVDVSQTVVVTTRQVEKGDKFAAGNVGLAKIPRSRIMGQCLDHLDNVLGRTAAMPLAPGTVLRINDLFDPPVIKRGQMVQAIVQYGNVEIAAQVRAIEDGKAGDVIRLENVEAHKLLKGKVLDEKTVLLIRDSP